MRRYGEQFSEFSEAIKKKRIGDADKYTLIESKYIKFQAFYLSKKCA